MNSFRKGSLVRCMTLFCRGSRALLYEQHVSNTHKKTHKHTHTRTNAHAHAYTRTNTHTNTHTHMHTRTNKKCVLDRKQWRTTRCVEAIGERKGGRGERRTTSRGDTRGDLYSSKTRWWIFTGDTRGDLVPILRTLVLSYFSLFIVKGIESFHVGGVGVSSV